MAKAKTKSLSRKESDRPEKRDFNDLCSTCNDSQTCVRRAHHGKPVWQCEEFDDFQSPSKVKVLRTAAAGETKPSKSLQGLCTNCDNREICVIPKADAGVWHCEEYQ